MAQLPVPAMAELSTEVESASSRDSTNKSPTSLANPRRHVPVSTDEYSASLTHTRRDVSEPPSQTRSLLTDQSTDQLMIFLTAASLMGSTPFLESVASTTALEESGASSLEEFEIFPDHFSNFGYYFARPGGKNDNGNDDDNGGEGIEPCRMCDDPSSCRHR